MKVSELKTKLALTKQGKTKESQVNEVNLIKLYKFHQQIDVTIGTRAYRKVKNI